MLLNESSSVAASSCRLIPVVLALVFVRTALLSAHEDPHHRIEAISRQIEADPGNAALYLKRGELHRVATHYELALEDFDRVQELEPENASVDFYRGRVFYDSGRFDEALKRLNAFLSTDGTHLVALATRARIFVQVDEPLKAVADYDRALALAFVVGPDLHVERAEALARTGEEHVSAAIAGIDRAIRELGPLIVLESKALDLELARGNFDGALERLQRVLVSMPRKERWLVKRGDILSLAGRPEAADESYRRALASLDALPIHLRDVPASRALEIRLRALLDGQTR